MTSNPTNPKTAPTESLELTARSFEMALIRIARLPQAEIERIIAAAPGLESAATALAFRMEAVRTRGMEATAPSIEPIPIQPKPGADNRVH